VLVFMTFIQISRIKE